MRGATVTVATGHGGEQVMVTTGRRLDEQVTWANAVRSTARKHNAFVKTRDSLGCLNPPHRRACIAGGPYVPWGWMTRWLWRRCPTRSHSELGRESLQRRWYFVLRHGRVGRCLVFQLHGSRPTGHSSGPACRYRHAGFGFDRGHALREDTRRTLILLTASPGRSVSGPFRNWRGVEQPGSSSGS